MNHQRKIYSVIGMESILVGVIILIENFFHTSWLIYLIPILGGLLFIYEGSKGSNKFLGLTGWIISIFGTVLIYIIQLQVDVINALGILFLAISFSWFAFFINIYLIKKETVFWALIPSYNFLSLGVVFKFTELRFLDFVFYLGLGVAISLLSSGMYWKLFGLIIPGSLLAGIIPGVYFPWADPDVANPLIQTGIMLVWFALGWGLITVFSRVQTQAFVWWPLIPGGILAMVGWGLYIGGNPESAVGFIGNTGSIALIIFGIYILLMKRGIHR